jgi:Cu(I)/Ag(I) efflux system membrane fusion protein
VKKIILLVSIVVVVSIVSAGSYSLGKRTSVVSAPVTAAKVERKILYYRNPMGLPDTSPVPKKDAMGMDYVPVYDGDTVQEDGAVNISVEKVQKLGVKSEAATLRSLNKTIQATGRIEIDERRTYTIAPKFEGWVERLYVNSTGETVGRGQALFDVYSPELVSAQREYVLAAQGEAKLANADEETKAGMKQLAEASLARLKNWDITPGEINQLTTGKSRRSLTYYAPVSGIVLEKKAVQGMRFMPGEALYQIADLASVWVLADISEQDIGQVKTGSEAQVSIGAYPDKSFKGRITFVYPTLNSATRTVQVRVEIANPQGLLKPSMFANVMLPVGSNTQVLTVPTSAVIDSGTRQVVLVQLAQGRFAPRTVKLGSRSNDYVEILDGLAVGEQVVTSALFLIDAESNLKAALDGLGAHTAHGGSTPVVEDHAVLAAPTEPKKSPAIIAHQGLGILEAINADGTVSITHEPIKSLGWPGMTMNFAMTNSSLAAGIKSGSKITFELIERKPDEWVIIKLQALAKQQHEGH